MDNDTNVGGVAIEVHPIVGQSCEACNGDGENYCEYANAMRTCPECMGTGVVDLDGILENEPCDGLVPMPDEATQKRLTAFAHECIRNSGGDVLPNVAVTIFRSFIELLKYGPLACSFLVVVSVFQVGVRPFILV